MSTGYYFDAALSHTWLATALPRLASEFNALNDLTWIVSAYLLTQTGFILIYGQLLTILPTKWVYLCAIFIFEVGSLLCGVAPSINVLVSMIYYLVATYSLFRSLGEL